MKLTVELSEGALGHLGEILREETDGVDASGGCIYCSEILRVVEATLRPDPDEETMSATVGRVGNGKLHVLARGVRMWRVACESGSLMLCAATPCPDASVADVDCKRCLRDLAALQDHQQGETE